MRMRFIFLIWVVFFLGAFQTGTQYFAHATGYPAALGEPVFHFFGLPIYLTFEIVYWVVLYAVEGPYYRNAFLLIGLIVLLDTFVALFLYEKRRRLENTGLYGSARWLKTKELMKLGFFTGKGVVLAQTDEASYKSKGGPEGLTWKQTSNGRLLYSNGPSHVLLAAPTRKGKGVGTIIPTLAGGWRESVVVYDIKKENWEKTAGFRRKFSHVIRFEPGADYTARWNPMLEIRPGKNDTKDVQNFVTILSNLGVKEEREPHWRLAAEQLLVGVILHVLYSSEDKSLAAVYDFLNSSDKKTMFETMLETRHRDDMTHPAVATAARNMLNKPENELGSIVSTASTYVQLWQDPEMRKSTSESDFMLDDIANSERPVSLYVVVSNEDKARMKPLVRMFFQMLARKLTARLNANKHRVLLLIDEFASLGRLEVIEEGIAFFAGYGVKLLLVVQSFNQLYEAYGQHTSIPDNCKTKIFLGADSVEDAERMSKFLGKQTVIRESISRSKKISSVADTNLSDSESEAERALLNPNEIMELPYNKSIITVSGQSPYLARKIFYYQDSRFRGRTEIKPPEDPDEQVKELPYEHKSPWDVFTIMPKPSSSTPRPQESDPLSAVGAVQMKMPGALSAPATTGGGAAASREGGPAALHSVGRMGGDLPSVDQVHAHQIEHRLQDGTIVNFDLSGGLQEVEKEAMEGVRRPAPPKRSNGDVAEVELDYDDTAAPVKRATLSHFAEIDYT